ncbi:right-handed parallel beta-helix repeat-containing protein [Thalassoglobus sp.]|uniref:right-handed parallel beta-helix repeat-containing protein n=1 Tax=Thalassoglobus sp. TaxID=2795869 RepID=UPI003AA7DF6A
MTRVSRHPFPQAKTIAILFTCFSTSLFAQQDVSEIEVANRTELIAAINRAQPGSKILIAPGEYRGGLSFENLRGTKEKPIILEGRDPRQPPVITGGTSGIHLRSPAHIELRNLVLQGATGNGLNIDDGGRENPPGRFVVLDRIHVKDVGPKGNRDGIKMSGIDDFVIKDCQIERWGDRGSAIDMVGCHQGEIKNCLFRYRSDIAASGVQMKGGSSEIVLHHCRFENAGSRAVNIGGSTGQDFFRPRNANYEAKRIKVEDCTIIGSMSPISFVGADGATVRYNTIYRPTRWVMRILQESQGPEFIRCRNGVFSNNIVAFRSDEVRTIVNIGGETDPETFKFANNHWYCLDNPDRSSQLKLPTTEEHGSYGKPPMFQDPEHGDFALSDLSPVQNAGVRQ